ncbi:MAG: hypothetical protein JO336_03570 [Acidobacteriia bacterium]|nr:hypothetical protein [Terriglobia bacterium]MBV8906888.1 hypothetical protein [Terriglobia bacterium]MBV9746132.1 hypothetical protein [Terriglobia bacterium]
MRQLVLVALLAALAVFAQADTVPALTLIPPSGDVSSVPGSVVGWGFNVTYTAPADWVVLTGSEFTGSTVYGNYVDYLSSPTNAPFYVVGPSPESSTLTGLWNPSSTPLSGLGEFDINPTALPGVSIPGDIVVHYSVFSGDPNDPNFNPFTETVVPDATISAPVDVVVTPEPAALFPVAVMLLAFAGSRVRRGIV